MSSSAKMSSAQFHFLGGFGEHNSLYPLLLSETMLFCVGFDAGTRVILRGDKKGDFGDLW